VTEPEGTPVDAPGDELEVFEPPGKALGADNQLRPLDRAEKIAEAYRLFNEDGYSSRMVAQRFGISPATAWRWIKQGQSAEVYAELLEQQQRRADAAGRLQFYRQLIVGEYRAGAAGVLDIMPHLLKIEEREAKLLALDKPVTLRHEFGDAAAPPAEVVAAVSAARAERDRRAAELDEEFGAGGDPS
jgi:predicted DNA-binding protein (UPF0251 family)